VRKEKEKEKKGKVVMKGIAQLWDRGSWFDKKKLEVNYKKKY